MKLLLAICLSMFASLAMACTDFTGNYRNGEGVDTQIKQSGCSSVTFTGNEGAGTLVTDGQYRMSQDDAEVRVMTAASFVGAALNIEGKLEYKQSFPPEVPTQYIARRFTMIYTKTTSGDVVGTSSVYNSENQVIFSQADTFKKL